MIMIRETLGTPFALYIIKLFGGGVSIDIGTEGNPCDASRDEASLSANSPNGDKTNGDQPNPL